MNDKQSPAIYLIVPVFNGIKDTVEFLLSLKKIDYENYEIVVIDDGSIDGTSEVIQNEFPYVHLLTGDGNLWWSGATNLGIKYALEKKADYVLTINNDNVVDELFLTKLYETSLNYPSNIIKSVGYDYDDRKKLVFWGGEIRWGECRFDQTKGEIKSGDRVVEITVGNGNSNLIPSFLFNKLGLFASKQCPQYHADAEFILRAKSYGYKTFIDRESIIYNKTEKSVGAKLIDTKSFYYLLTNKKSPYYYKALIYLYKKHCPNKIYYFTLLFGYYNIYKILKNRKKSYKIE
jgi:GT2 family glycosyltransferase